MNKRIKELRKALDITQQEFADRINIKRNTLANYEVGRNEPIDAVVSLICREFNVNEEWLRTGTGEMFKQTEESAVSRLCAELHASDLEAGIIRAYFRIDPQIRDSFMRRLLEEVQTEYSTAPASAPSPVPAPPAKYPQEMTDDEVRAELDRQLAEEKKREESGSASGRGNSEKAIG